MRYRFAIYLPILLNIATCSLVLAYSNSEYTENTGWDDIITAQDSAEFLSSKRLGYISLDDSEYHYTGIPRIVIVTETIER